jgi:hypothetical protein
MSDKLWPATNGVIPKTPAEWKIHFDYMAELGRQLRQFNRPKAAERVNGNTDLRHPKGKK